LVGGGWWVVAGGWWVVGGGWWVVGGGRCAVVQVGVRCCVIFFVFVFVLLVPFHYVRFVRCYDSPPE